MVYGVIDGTAKLGGVFLGTLAWGLVRTIFEIQAGGGKV